MASEGTPERVTRSPEVTVISITVTGPPPRRAHPPQQWLMPRWALAVVAVSLALATLGAIVATVLLGGRPTRSASASRAEPVPSGERAEIARSLGYPYPPQCLTITISAGTPDFARANVDRTNGCGRYHGYINASLHRVDGEWRLALDEGQLFVPNSLLAPCLQAPACVRPTDGGWTAVPHFRRAPRSAWRPSGISS